MPEPAILCEALTKRFGDRAAVDAIDLRVERGEVFGLLGPNGAGKTTTIAMLTTLLAPTGGRALVAGHDVARESARVRRQVGLVFQEPSLDTLLTGRENLELHGRLYGIPAGRLQGRVDEMLDLVQLGSRGGDRVRTYSGGMKRRLEIARGLLHQPAVLFLDEPTLGLDPQTREHIWAYIRRLRDEFGTTVLLTTHYMDEADNLCDRIAIIDYGKIIALDAPRALKGSLGGDIVRLRQAKPDPEGLAKLGFVEKAIVVEGETVVTIEDAPANLPKLLAAAGEVRSVEVRRPTLEDVFIRLTGHELRDSTEKGEAFADTFFRAQQGGSN